MLVVKAQVKEVAKGYNVAGDVSEAIDKIVEEMIKKGCQRAEGNGRKTLMAKDL